MDKEGVIKFHLHHQQRLLSGLSIANLNAWRTLIFRLGLIGRHPEKYDNLGYGNISQRPSENSRQFIISGTQTGHLEQLSAAQYCLISDADPAANELHSQGLVKPSSESLTHASVYAQNSHIQAVIHGHCPEIWRNTAQLQLAHTSAQIAYGTPDMAFAVQKLFTESALTSTGLFTMLGHEDGVIAFGNTLSDAAMVLIHYLQQAIQLQQSD
ncbi:MAG: class II aldolase/adducin family protein [Methylococcales bacterium]